MKTLVIVGLGSILGLALVTGCAAAAGVNDGVVPEQGSPPASDQGTGAPTLTRWRLPLLEVGGGGIDRGVGSLTPGVTILDPSGDGTGTPSGDGTGTPSGDGTGTPSGDGTSAPSGDGASAPSGDGTSTPSGDGTSTPAVEQPVVIETGPQILEGNPTCADRFGPDVLALRVEQLKDGTYTNGGFSATLDFNGSSLDYTCSGGTLLGVVVKGGPHANLYTTSEVSGTDLATPAGEGVSHVDFCYRLD